MANETFAWLIRFKDIEREYRVTRFATDHLLRSLRTGTANLESDLKILDVNRASRRLQSTYIASLFSEFERGLKRFLRVQGLRKLPRNAEPLINRAAARAYCRKAIATRPQGSPVSQQAGPPPARGGRIVDCPPSDGLPLHLLRSLAKCLVNRASQRLG